MLSKLLITHNSDNGYIMLKSISIIIMLFSLIGCVPFKQNNSFDYIDHGLNKNSERIFNLEKSGGSYTLAGAEKDNKIINFQIYNKPSGVNVSILYNDKGEIEKISFLDNKINKVINIKKTTSSWEVD